MGSSNTNAMIGQNLCFPVLKTNDTNQYAIPDSNSGNRFGINRNTNTNTNGDRFGIPDINRNANTNPNTNDSDTISGEEVDERMKAVGKAPDPLKDFFNAFFELKDKKDSYNIPTTANERADLQKVYEDARNTTAAQDDLARNAAMQAAMNQGVSGAKASALAGSKTPIGNAAQNISTARSNWVAQKNEELQRKAQADALARETANIEKGRDYNVLTSVLGGGAAGADIVSRIFGGFTGGSTGGGKQ